MKDTTDNQEETDIMDTTDYKATADKMRKRIEAGMPDDAAYWLMELERDVSHKEDRVVEAAQSVIDTATRTIQTVRTGATLNSLGELQSRGPELDRRVAEACFAQDALTRGQAYIRRLFPEAAEEV